MKIIQEFTSSRGWPKMLIAGSRLVCVGQRDVCVYDMKTWELIQSFKTVPVPVEEERIENALYLDFWFVNRCFVLLNDGPIAHLPKLEKPCTAVLATLRSFDLTLRQKGRNDFSGLIAGETISPDLKRVFFCGEEHLGILYDSATGAKISEYAFKNKRKCLYSPSFSNNGHFIAVSNTGSDLYVIDTKTNAFKEFSFPKLEVRPLAWTQDDQYIIVAAKKKILFVDPERGQVAREIAIKTNAYFALQSKDSKFLLLGFHVKWNSSLHLVDLTTENVLYKHELNGFATEYNIDAVFLDEKHFVIATDTVSIIESATGKQIHELTGNHGVFNEIALSQSEDEIFLGDGRLGRVVNFRTGKEIAQWKDLPKLDMLRTRFSIDGKNIIAKGSDVLYVFDKRKQKTVLVTECSWDIHLEVVSPDTSKVIVGKADKLFVHRVADGKKLYELKASDGRAPDSAVFTPDSKMLLLVYKTPCVQFVDAETGSLVKEIVIENSSAWKFKAGFMDNPEYFWIAPGTGKPMGKEVLNIYRTSTFELIKSLETDYLPLKENDRSMNAGTIYVTTTYDRVPGGGHRSGILIYDWMSEKVVRHDFEDDLEISCYLSAPEHRCVIYGCADGSIYRFDLSDNSWTQVVKGDENGRIVKFHISPSGKYLAAYFAGRLDLYDMNSWQLYGTIPSRNPEEISLAVFDPNGQYIANMLEGNVSVSELS